MLEIIKQKLFEKNNATDVKGLFLSCFDEQSNLLASQGMLQTDQPLETVLTTLVQQLAATASKTKVVVCDVVGEVKQEIDVNKLLAMSPVQFGICVVSLDGSQRGVLLPGTAWVADMKHALFTVKQKHAINGQVNVYVFSTQRIAVAV